MAQSEERLAVFKKIAEFEEMGKFNEDVENDPPTTPLNPEDVDYLNTKWIHRVQTRIANQIAKQFIHHLIRKKQLIIQEVIGYEHLTNISGGFVLTCNHFHPFDNFALHEVLLKHLKQTKKRFYKVIREGNFTFPGLYGYFFRNCDTLPLSSNFQTMKCFTQAIDTILKRGDIVLVYPEQAMWWNYRKPRPVKSGAYRYAVKANVPVVPCFITMRDTEEIGKDGFPIQAYTLHFLSPIYPDLSLSMKDAIEKMAETNYQMWKETYETFYQVPLCYNTKGVSQNDDL